MYLKNLFLSGFKSFANAQTISFDPEISAIVGPNGSGKSNISDAVRFVLGEQRTKQLRSKKMEDIIFSGTDSEGARGSAEVRLVLDCGEEPDLIISRKFYRTGESSYYINNRRVRLKDIYDLFSDTGIGKNGYSIVSQGGVEQIIDASPNDLRRLVEEATGVSGFKLKRDETNSRLEDIREGIQRLEDILGEIKKQLKPLGRQAEKTRRFLEISEVLKTVDLIEFYESHKNDKEKLKKLEEELGESEARLQKLDASYYRQDRIYVDLKNKNRELSERITQGEEELKRLYVLKDEKKDDYSTLLLQKDRKKQRYESVRKKRKDLSRDVSEKSTELTSLGQRRRALLEAHKGRRQAYDTILKEIRELERLFREIETEQKRKADFEEEKRTSLDELGLRLSEQNRDLERITTKIEFLNKTLGQTVKTKNALKGELKTLVEKRADLKAELGEKENAQKALRERLALEEETLRKKRKKLTESRRKLESILHELNFENKLKQTYQAYNYGVKNAMKRFGGDTGVYGPLADLIHFPRKFSLALQTALGNKAQDIVVENESVAREIIDYLKREKKGRVTLLPVKALRHKEISEREKQAFLNQRGFIALAADLCEYDVKIEAAVKNALGRVAVLEDFKAATLFRKKYPYLTGVTLDGEIFYPGGAIVGGMKKKDSPSVLFQNLKIDELEDQKGRLSKETALLERDVEKSEGALESLRKDLQEQERLLRDTRDELTVVELKITNTKERMKSESAVSKRAELKDLDKEREKLTALIRKNEEAIDLLEKKEFERQDYDLGKLNRQKLELSEKRAAIEVKLEFGLKEIKSCDEEIKQAQNALEELEEKLRADEDFFNAYPEEAKKEEERLTRLKEEAARAEEKLKELTDLDEDLREEKRGLEADLAQSEEKIRNLSSDQNSERENAGKLKLALERINLKLNNEKNKIFETYGLTYLIISEQIEGLYKKKEGYKDLDIDELRKERRAIGSVNVDAIEDYNALRERSESYQRQHEDLLDSEKDIEATIEKINASIKEQFEKEFDRLNAIFSDTFKKLFEGGKARLDYSDPLDTLNSGIELSAQPPGKNLKHISLLSGGEKAMTAIALLFSMLELNPSPFTIIDEIDAALDDSNIFRFTQFITKIKAKNQFIIITHRKNTLRICEKINGITMASNGVSKLCSIDVADYIK